MKRREFPKILKTIYLKELKIAIIFIYLINIMLSDNKPLEQCLKQFGCKYTCLMGSIP